jgi:hypothetical protein
LSLAEEDLIASRDLAARYLALADQNEAAPLADLFEREAVFERSFQSSSQWQPIG